MNRNLNSSAGKNQLCRLISIDKKMSNHKFDNCSPANLSDDVNTLRNINQYRKKLFKIVTKIFLERKQKGFKLIKEARNNNKIKQKQLKIINLLFTNKLYNMKYYAFTQLLANQSKKILKEKTSLTNKMLDLESNTKQLQIHKNKLIQFNSLADGYIQGTTQLNQINTWFKSSADKISPETKRLKSLIVKINDYKIECNKQKKLKERLETSVNQLSLKVLKTNNTKTLQDANEKKISELNQIIQLLQGQKINQLKLDIDKNKYPTYRKLIEKIYEIWKRIPSPIDLKYFKTITDKISELIVSDHQIEWTNIQKYLKSSALIKSKLENSDNQIMRRIVIAFKMENIFYNYCKTKANESPSNNQNNKKQLDQLKLALEKQKQNRSQKEQENIKLQYEIHQLTQKQLKLQRQFEEYKQNQRVKYQSSYSKQKNKSNSTKSLNNIDTHDQQLEQLIRIVNKPCSQCQTKNQQVNRMLLQLNAKQKDLNTLKQNFNKQLNKFKNQLLNTRNNSNQLSKSLNSIIQENTQLNLLVKKNQNDLNDCYQRIAEFFKIKTTELDKNLNFSEQIVKLVKLGEESKKIENECQIKKLKKQIELFKEMVGKKLIDDKIISQDQKLIEYKNSLIKLKEILKFKDKIIDELKKKQKHEPNQIIDQEEPASIDIEITKDLTHFDLEYKIHELRVQNTHLTQTINKLTKDKSMSQEKIYRFTNEIRYLNKQKEIYIKQIKKKQLELKKSFNIIENLSIITKNSNNLERKTSNKTFVNQLEFQSTKTEPISTINFHKLYEKLIPLLPPSYTCNILQINDIYPITILFYQILKNLTFNDKLEHFSEIAEQSIELYILYAQSNKANSCFDLLLKFIKTSYNEIMKIKNKVIILSQKSECHQLIKFLKSVLIKSIGEQNMQSLLKKYLSNQSEEIFNEIQPFSNT